MRCQCLFALWSPRATHDTLSCRSCVLALVPLPFFVPVCFLLLTHLLPPNDAFVLCRNPATSCRLATCFSMNDP